MNTGDRNVVVLSEEDEKGREFFARGVNWVSTEPRSCEATVKMRAERTEKLANLRRGLEVLASKKLVGL